MLLAAYLPNDRRQALALDLELSDTTHGAALFADISGFTSLTDMLDRALSARQGVEALTNQLNRVYDALIAEVDRAGGSVIGFSGDAITCWFSDENAEFSVLSSELSETQNSKLKTQNSAAQRAANCAMAMQRAMGEFARVALPNGGHTSLALKVAITSGPARRFLVGDPAIQYLEALAGATVLRLANAEHLARSGDVIVDAPTLAALPAWPPSEWQVDDATGERFAVLSGEFTGEHSPDDELGASALAPFLTLNAQPEKIRPWLLPAVYARLRAGLGEFMTELRPAVALFLRFSGIDYERADAGAQLDAYVCWVQHVLARYDGVLLDITIGDKGSYLYAAFGAPLAHEDDDRRAVAAALELRVAPAELAWLEAPQIGISRGTMRTGAYGAASRRTYGVLGNEVNLAARLMGRAAAGEILISRRVQKVVGTLFVLEPLPPVRLKGLPEPVPVFRVAGERRRALRLAEPAYTLPMVGRAVELEQIAARLELALRGRGQLVGITGEAGQGKSRLAAEAIRLAQRRGLRGFGGACQSYGTNTPYLVWQPIWRSFFGLGLDAAPHRQLRALAALLQELAPDRIDALPLLGPLLGLELPENDFTRALGPPDRKSALEALLLACLQTAAREAAAERSGLLFVLEDLHWIDPASHDLLDLLARSIVDAPVLVVLAYRPLDLLRLQQPRVEALPHFTAIALEALPDAASEQVARAKLAQLHPERQAPAPPAVIGQIVARAQGNPFYVEELLNYLHDREIDPWDLRTPALELPNSMHSLVLSRIDQLSERQKATLKSASVIGRVFQLSWLRGAYPALGTASSLRADLDELARLDVTPLDTPEPDLTYLFKHIVTQEVVYASMTAAARARFHQQLARFLEALAPERWLDLLAYHYGQAGVRDKTLRYLDLAARKAEHEYATEAALGYRRAALALEQRWEWRQAEAEALHILGRRAEQVLALQALEADPAAPHHAVAQLWAHYYEALGDYPAARAAAERALHAGPGQLEQVRCLALLGLIARRQGAYEQAEASYQAALALFTDRHFPTPAAARAFAQALNGLGVVQRQRGDFAAARASYEQAVRVCTASGDRRGEADALDNLGTVAYRQRRLADAAPYHRQALAIRRVIGDLVGQGASLLNLAQALRDAGDYGQAQAHLQSALAIQQLAGNRWEEINIWNDLGILYQELGQLDQAEAALQRGLELCRQIDDEVGQAYVLANLGLAARDRDDLPGAKALFARGHALAQAHREKALVAAFLSYLGAVDLQLGLLEPAIQQAQAALSIRRELDMRLRTTADLCTIAAAMAAQNELAQGLAYAQQALAILDECGGLGPEQPQQDYFICAQILAAAGHADAASLALQSAHRLVSERAERIVDPALRQSFLQRVPINRAIVMAITAGLI